MPLTGIYGKGGSGKNTIVAYFKLKYFSRLKTYVNFTLRTPNTEKIDSIMSLENRIQSYLLFQARKNNMSIISISQLSILDIRWRKLEEHLILCMDRDIYDKNLNPSKKDFRYIFSNGKKNVPFTLKYNTAKKVFPFFDTREKILPKDFQRLKTKLDMQNPKKRNKVVNKIVDKILNVIKKSPVEKKDVTHIWIKNIMMDLELPDLSLEPYVYIRLKSKL